MESIKLAYFTGLLDAEGAVSIVKRKWPTGATYLCPVVTIGMTDENLIRECHAFFGKGTVTTRVRPNHKTAYIWATSHRGAEHVAAMTAPYSIIKRPKLLSVLAHYNTIPLDTVVLSETFLNAYFAGFIDGDGHVKVTKSAKTGEFTSPTIVVVNTSEKLILACKDHFSCGSILHVKATKPNHNDFWRWVITYGDARRVAAAIRPYSILKQKELDSIIDLPQFDHASKRTLSDEDVKEMRKLHEQGLTFVQLGVRYNLNPSSVTKIIKRKTYKHVE